MYQSEQRKTENKKKPHNLFCYLLLIETKFPVNFDDT